MARDKLLERIRKLFAMSMDANSANEAAIAAKRMRSLMLEHGVTLDEVKKSAPSDFSEFTAGANYTSPPGWFCTLTIAACKLCDCRSVKRTCRLSKRRELLIQGLSADAIVAQMTLEYFLSVLNAAIEEEQKPVFGTNRKYLSDYRIGFAIEINSRVDEIKKETKTSNSTELMVVKNTLITDHFGTAKKGRKNTVKKVGIGYLKGLHKASTVGLSKQIDENEVHTGCD